MARSLLHGRSQPQLPASQDTESRTVPEISPKSSLPPLRVGCAEINLDLGQVRSPGGTVTELRRQSADLLRLLAARRGQTVSKAELLDGIWGVIAVTEDSLVQCIGDIRRALGAEREMLATVQRIGYRLRHQDEGAPVAIGVAASRSISSLPTIAVFGMADAAAADLGHVLTGFVEDLGHDLAQRTEIRVIAQGVGARIESSDDLVAARKIGAGHLVLCRLTDCDGGVRLVIQLLDAASGEVRWSDRYRLSREFDASDGLRLRAAAVAGLIAGLDGAIIRLERERLRGIARNSDDAYELYALAGDGLETDDREASLAGLALAERCVAVDPGFASGWLMINWRRCRLFTYGWGDDATDRLRREAVIFRTAVNLEPRDPVALGFLAVSRAKCGALSEARRLIDRAAELAQDRPDAAAELSFPISTIAGRPDLALRLLDRALDRHPRPPDHWGYMEARAAFLAGQYERAVAASDLSPDCVPKLVFRTLSQAELGAPEAVVSWTTLIDHVPSFDFHRYARDLPIADSAALAAYAAAQVKLRAILATNGVLSNPH